MDPPSKRSFCIAQFIPTRRTSRSGLVIRRHSEGTPAEVYLCAIHGRARAISATLWPARPCHRHLVFFDHVKERTPYQGGVH